VDARIQIAGTRQMARQALLNMNKHLEQTIEDRTSALQQANSELTRKNAELENLNSDLRTFAFAASHDLSEPLRKILTFASLLAEREPAALSTKGKELIDKIVSSTARMKMLIDEILSYSQAQQTPLTVEHVDLNGIIEQVKSDLYSLILEKNAVIEHGKLPVVRCYPLQFSRLFQNIISNSIKFCPPDRVPRIVISASLVDGKTIRHQMALAGKRYLKIEIRDNGIGFDPQYSERIFQMFQRLHSRNEYPGSGMGLAICKKIVENHFGFIMTDSKLGEGARFCCHFPADMVVSGL
jgi:light-regulated signal transduction histidine kinase (bacteriophytochrome)